ncbi:HD domain-containing protein [Tumebacillus sp. ITR2]|uniref:HD domain-containing protein n=1 Tax=Tumebacillus amylolyticus TaxID=2801339 RepID=A0ABS1J9W6_9BACL|nr:HD domain-containing protein [Tumebacillus amylolyticus]MBL0386428.1 HD domain-containing protein [Tumebacillus amylolyticus]
MTEWVDKEKVFKDPVHDYIYVFDKLIWDLINTRAFQRLRRVRQLGTAYLTYHGAEHTRFTHSLGVYETMRKVLSHFERKFGWPGDERTRLLALCAALLHDIGHGPFSHTIETVFKFHHEEFSQRILLEEPEVNKILRRVDDQFPQDVADVIAKKDKYPLVVKLISSQLDVDRMDYLLRDAVNTGVTYGRFELERLIRVMRPEGNDILVKMSGQQTVEQYILARYFMYSQVYLHPVTLSSDVLLKHAFLRAKKLHERGQQLFLPEELQPFLGKDNMDDLTVEEYLRLDESVMMYTFHRWTESDDAILRDLADRFINRRLYGSILTRELKEVEKQTVRDMFRAQGLNPEYYIAFGHATGAGYHMYRQGITLVDDDGDKMDIADASALVRSLKPLTQHRIFCPKEVLRGEGSYKPIRGWLEALKI